MKDTELRLLGRYLKKRKTDSLWLFLSEQGTVITTRAFSGMLAICGKKAGFDFRIYPHMLRH